MGLSRPHRARRAARRRDRRAFLRGAGLTALVACASGGRALAQRSDADARRFAAPDAFPFEHVVLPSDAAFPEWERLRSPGVAPVIIGAPNELRQIAAPFDPAGPAPEGGPPPLEEVLANADALRFPTDLRAIREREAAAFFEKELERAHDPVQQARNQLMDELFPLGLKDWTDSVDAPLGDWPEHPPEGVVSFRAPLDDETGGAAEELAILLVPTDDPTTVPAHLRWGGWSANPPAEHHVAALRSWRERYGAELVSLTSDTMDLRVARRPGSRREALDLAREHYWYCRGVIDQETLDLSGRAALLMGSDWWRFWWD